MTDLQKEFEATGYTSWINSDIYPDGKIHTKEYTEWLESKVSELRKEKTERDKTLADDISHHYNPIPAHHRSHAA